MLCYARKDPIPICKNLRSAYAVVLHHNNPSQHQSTNEWFKDLLQKFGHSLRPLLSRIRLMDVDVLKAHAEDGRLETLPQKFGHSLRPNLSLNHRHEEDITPIIKVCWLLVVHMKEDSCSWKLEGVRAGSWIIQISPTNIWTEPPAIP